jgi:hypothetical protein
VERTRKPIALLLTAIAMSVVACGGSTSSSTAPVASSVATEQAPVAPASSSPSTPASASADVSWKYGGSLPSGWTEEDGTYSRSEKAYIDIMTDRSVMAADCALGPQPNVGRSAKDVVGALSRRPGLATTAPSDVTVGGLDGRQVDIGLAPDWKKSCDWWGDPTSPVVPLVGTFDDKNLWLYTAATKGEHYRYVVLDASGGRNVVIAITAVAPEQFNDVAGSAMTIIHGLQFFVPG